MRILYSMLYTAVFLISVPYFLVVGLLKKKYLSTIFQRFGSISISSETPSLWIHAVSVGEFLAARPLIRNLREKHPELPIFVSTTTITGQKLARELVNDRAFYFPFDWKWCIRRVFRKIRPGLILILETEIWPNFLWEANDQKVSVILVNGRISDRSFSRYKFFRGVLPRFNEAWMQTTEDARRMAELNYDPQTVFVMGNLKFDFRPAVLSDSFRQLLSKWKKQSLLWIVGSTVEGEEPRIIETIAVLPQHMDIKILIAPRHPERFQQVLNLLGKAGLKVIRRSENRADDVQVMLLDTIGELASAYEFADLVFIGGTLSYGGHNPIEPAYYGKPVVSGPHFENFRVIFEEFRRRNAIFISSDLKKDVPKLLLDQDLRERIGNAARQLVQENEGATSFVIQRIGNWIHDWNNVEPGPKSIVR
jgi:3-deoxy-D-manno-octulosonic-acid transferase